ncbi:hypothetical protein [Streptomyces chartreusis]|uniref:hypothetical protein n=1 Tax=Streptomyces chartreusis TaxID=1969 RepID=UPI0033B84EA3
MSAGQGGVGRHEAAVTAERALDLVGLTVRKVFEAAGEVMDKGSAHLVGSLAAGFGNARSDVDIHVIERQLARPVGPHMFFVDGIPVDVERFPARWVAESKRKASAQPVAETPVGRIALDGNIGNRACRVMSRWIHAVPLNDTGERLFSPSERQRVLPLLVRNAYDHLLAHLALARLADAAQVPAATRAYLWRRTSRQLLELRCRDYGDVTVNAKWLTARAQRLGLPHATEAEDAAPFWCTAGRCGLPDVDAWEVTRLTRSSGTEVIDLAGRRLLATRHRRLLDEWCPAEGSMAELIDAIGPARLFQAITHAELDLSVDSEAVRRALSE